MSDLLEKLQLNLTQVLVKYTLKKDALFSSLLVSLQGDLAVKESNLYSLKKLLDRDEVKKDSQPPMDNFIEQ